MRTSSLFPSSGFTQCSLNALTTCVTRRTETCTISQGEFTERGGGSWVRGIVRILQFDKFWGKNKKFRKIQNARYRKLSFNLNFRITSQTSLAISLNTGLSTKDETSKTTVRNSCCMYVPTVSNNYKILHFFAKSLVI